MLCFLSVGGKYESLADLYRLDPHTLQWEELGQAGGHAPSATLYLSSTTAQGLFLVYACYPPVFDENTGVLFSSKFVQIRCH